MRWNFSYDYYKNLYIVRSSYEACDGEDMSGCFHLGRMWFKGYGGLQDKKNARMLFKEACDGGEMESYPVKY